MPIIGAPRNFFAKFKFIVEVDGIASAGFQKCSELSVEIGKVEYHEGGAIIPYKSPGKVKFTDVTLERGATLDRDFWDWVKQVADAASGFGLVNPNFKRNLDIVQQERDGSTLRRFPLSGAWPIKYVAGDWDNESDDHVIEKVTLTYDYFDFAD